MFPVKNLIRLKTSKVQRHLKGEAVDGLPFWFYVFSLVKLEDCHEGALRNFDGTDLAHPLLSLLLFLEKFSLTGDITSVTFRSNVLAHSLDCLSSDDLCSDCSLDGNIELLSRDEFLQLLAHLASEVVGMISMDKGRERIGRITIKEDIKLHKLSLLESYNMLIERGISL